VETAYRHKSRYKKSIFNIADATLVTGCLGTMVGRCDAWRLDVWGFDYSVQPSSSIDYCWADKTDNIGSFRATLEDHKIINTFFRSITAKLAAR
jgi:hypothetical protein